MSLQREHQLILNQRKELQVFGVEELISFDEQGVEINTVQGILMVSGEGISVSGLDLESGTVTVGGRIDAMEYLPEKNTSRLGLFSRWFSK